MSRPSEKILEIAKRIPEVAPHLETEEATKNALVMPFIAALGYDVFNPREVIPEFTADVGTKKGEKVDYAIKTGDEIVMLIECKASGANLKAAEMSQLYRYFTATKARIGVLTNGVQYRFYSDLEDLNRMDQRPFLVLDLSSIRREDLAEVEKLAKGAFNLDEMLSAASELKILRELKAVLQDNLEEPNEDLVRFFYSETNPGSRFTSGVKDRFAPLVQKALHQFVAERVDLRLRAALECDEAPKTEPVSEDADEPDDGIVTTEEELEGFHIIKAIVRDVIDPNRVVYRDTKSYMGVLVDDNNRKPLVRLHFNRAQKYVGLFDTGKRETRHAIDNLDGIYSLADALREAAKRYSDEEGAES